KTTSLSYFHRPVATRDLHSFPTRRSSDLIAFGIDRMMMVLAREANLRDTVAFPKNQAGLDPMTGAPTAVEEEQLRELGRRPGHRSEEHTSELQSRGHLVCRLLLEKKKKKD